MTATQAKVTLETALALYFRDRPGQWIDGRLLAHIAGAYAWRSRISEIRRPPFAMRIENRQRRVRRHDGAECKVSEYCYLPGPPA